MSVLVGNGRCCLVQRAQDYFISGLGVIGWVPLLQGVTGCFVLDVCAYFIVCLPDHLVVAIVNVLV